LHLDLQSSTALLNGLQSMLLKTAANKRFCATWAGPANFQQKFAIRHWLWG
jgi:hypothetical protein